jgi:hypothetical protein
VNPGDGQCQAGSLTGAVALTAIEIRGIRAVTHGAQQMINRQRLLFMDLAVCWNIRLQIESVSVTETIKQLVSDGTSLMSDHFRMSDHPAVKLHQCGQSAGKSCCDEIYFVEY